MDFDAHGINNWYGRGGSVWCDTGRSEDASFCD